MIKLILRLGLFGLAMTVPSTAIAQSVDVEYVQQLHGIWVREQNPTAEWLNRNSLNSAIVIDLDDTTPWVFDRGVGGVFPITRLRQVSEDVMLLHYYFHRGGFEVLYSVTRYTGSSTLNIRHVEGLSMQEFGSRDYDRLPGIDPSDQLLSSPRFDPTTATVNGQNLRLREGPSLDETILALLDEGEELVFLEPSQVMVAIGQDYSYWYLVETNAGLRGWVYGAFVDLSRPFTP